MYNHSYVSGHTVTQLNVTIYTWMASWSVCIDEQFTTMNRSGQTDSLECFWLNNSTNEHSHVTENVSY